jgi:Arsenate reductase and related proteins, glutaredoxin family
MVINNRVGVGAVPITIYGIKNCDTMKKARAWLDKHGVDYAFHDYKCHAARSPPMRCACPSSDI